MKRTLFWILSMSLCALGAQAAEPARPAKPAKNSAQVKRGEFLVMMGSCNDCHTPMKFDPELNSPVPDMSRMLSGHPEGAPDPSSILMKPDLAVIGGTFTSFAMPFGTVYSLNLTPDRETGLGTWTEAMFIRALKTGKHMGGDGRPILAPMPWPTLAQLSESDLKAIFAYLRSIPPIRNGVPSAKVSPEALEQLQKSHQKLMERMKPRPKKAANP